MDLESISAIKASDFSVFICQIDNSLFFDGLDVIAADAGERCCLDFDFLFFVFFLYDLCV